MKQVQGWAFPDVDRFMSDEIKADGTYQASHLRMALEYVTDFTVAVDGGSHVGTWSRLLAQRFQRVVAVEPSDDTFEALSANMRKFECVNVELCHVALGAAPGSVTMILDGRALSLANTGARCVKPGGAIPLVTIDSWNLPSLGFLKLDVEGSEVAALQGAIETLKRYKPIVLFEDKKLWRRYGHRADAVEKFLLSLGYRHLQRAGCDEIYGVVQ